MVRKNIISLAYFFNKSVRSTKALSSKKNTNLFKSTLILVAFTGLLGSFSACSNDSDLVTNPLDLKENTLETKEQPYVVDSSVVKVSLNIIEAAEATRAGYLDYTIQDGAVPRITTNSNFHTFAFIQSNKGRKAYFEFDWTQVEADAQRNVRLTAKDFEINLQWIDTQNLGTTINPDPSETWQICGIAGGASMQNGKLVFNEERVNNNRALRSNQIKTALYSRWAPVTISNVNSLAGTMNFNPLGVTFQVKITERDNVGSKTSPAFRFNCNSITPNGSFDFTANSSSWTTSNARPKWDAVIEYEERRNPNGSVVRLPKPYSYTYTGGVQNLSSVEKQDMFIVWGMPTSLARIERPTTSVISLAQGVTVSRPTYYTPYTSNRDFTFDASQGRTFFINVESTRLRPSPEVNYPIPLARFAPYNVGTTPGTFARDNTVPTSGSYSWEEAANQQARIIPAGWHLPSKEEWTMMFPMTFVEDKRGREELLTETLRSLGRVRETARIGDLNLQFTSEYTSKGNGQTLYGIRFEDDNNPNPQYRNIFRSAYRYDFNGYWTPNATVTIRARYIGNAPVTLDQIASDDFWLETTPDDIVVTLPFAGGYSRRQRGNLLGPIDHGTTGNYWLSNDRNGYNPITNDKIYGYRRYNGAYLSIRPVRNENWRQ